MIEVTKKRNYIPPSIFTKVERLVNYMIDRGFFMLFCYWIFG